MTQITASRQHTIATITFSRETGVSVLTPECVAELSQCLQTMNEDAHVAVIILSGEGKSFNVGADIKRFAQMDEPEKVAFAAQIGQLLTSMETLNKPIIAAVNGLAIGGGLLIALACDFIYASEDAQFSLPENKLGMIPAGGHQRLSDRIGIGFAKELIATGRMITADQAFHMGLVNRVCAPADLITQVSATAAEITANSPHAVGVSKRVLHQVNGLSGGDADLLEYEAAAEAATHPDAQEGFQAFMQKRAPQWQLKIP